MEIRIQLGLAGQIDACVRDTKGGNASRYMGVETTLRLLAKVSNAPMELLTYL